ncbi:hypothetical protein [Halobacillus sp. Nhm2S1]|uniref:hypothetical protein n=1 Tax=Halobacillus sp. Nhm2S1 TaxID=2866716 RepID=UPI001C73C002|nr:hypothetical protein [Halobacillus sp. Nhm2S1]MBX0356725.1 hypothetical protein [Halobacillus sp. Nhm2S1]
MCYVLKEGVSKIRMHHQYYLYKQVMHLKKRGILSFAITILLLLAVWMMVGKAGAYDEPEEALHATEEGLTLIPVQQVDKEALFFFIKDDRHIGAAKVQKGIFGWKAGMMSMNLLDTERIGGELNRLFVHGDDLVYSLVRKGDERSVKVGDEKATMLNVKSLLPEESEFIKLRWNDLYVWYIEKSFHSHKEIKLLHKPDGEVIDSMVLKR